MPRRPWTEQELADLRAVQPGDSGAIARLARQYGRSKPAISAKLAVLRRRREAEDVRPAAKGDPFPARRFY